MLEERRRRHGPAPLDAAEKRRHCASVRLNDAELAWLDAARASVGMQRGEYLRAAALDRLPPQPAPEVNRSAWLELARAAGNLNQLAHHLNSIGGAESADVPGIAAELARFRAALIGAQS